MTPFAVCYHICNFMIGTEPVQCLWLGEAIHDQADNLQTLEFILLDKLIIFKHIFYLLPRYSLFLIPFSLLPSLPLSLGCVNKGKCHLTISIDGMPGKRLSLHLAEAGQGKGSYTSENFC